MNEYNEMCWKTGLWLDVCDCQTCSHRSECSGSDLHDDDD